MKVYSLLAGLSVCLGFATSANAAIYHGTVQNYFEKVYALDVDGVANRPEFDAACKSKHWYLVGQSFFVDYRVNTDSGLLAAFVSFANAETALSGNAKDVSKTAPGRYVFSSKELPQQLKDVQAKVMYFTLDKNYNHSTTQLVFANTDGQPYQCVLSSYLY